MKRVLICAAVVAATWVAPLAMRTPLAQTPAAAASSTVARVIVKFRSSSPLLRKQALSVTSQHTAQAAALGQRIGIALDTGRGISDRSQVVFGRGLTSKQLAARIAVEGDVEYAVADERKHIVAVPNDPLYAAGPAVTATNGGPVVGQWYLKPPGAAGDANNTAPAAINAQQAWDITTGSASVVVAVLDTGVRFDHPDLKGGNVLPGYDMVTDDASSGDNDPGRDTDALDPGDFVTAAEAANIPNCSPSPSSSWHGTQTLGLIGAATNNGVGIASVGRSVRVMPVRVLGKCGGYDSDIQAGIRWAAGLHVPNVPDNATPARVINMSLGGEAACDQGYIDAIGQANAAGTVVVASAGNSSGHPVSSPANCPGAIGVAALRHVGDKVGFSDIGPQITIAAPGGNCINTGTGQACLYPIVTTTNKGTTTPISGPPGAGYTDSFDASLGTSFSSPLVAGTVALMLSANPSLTPAQVKAKLQSTARPFPTTGGTAGIQACVAPVAGVDQGECYCTTSTCGAGMLDAHAAVVAVSGVQASISLTTTTPTANQDVALTSNSPLNPGQSIASYAWTILNAGTSGAAIIGANDGASVVVRPTASGVFVIQLTTTDNTGFVSTTTLSVSVVGPVTPPASAPEAAPSGGGGGALGVGWLLLLLAAVLSLAGVAARERAALSAAPARPGRTD
ncbi:MAG TPA: S8 family serine peptidase [Caldimonas sp.]|nr:S8 family serine peptidase [Caldimonas sp.]